MTDDSRCRFCLLLPYWLSFIRPPPSFAAVFDSLALPACGSVKQYSVLSRKRHLSLNVGFPLLALLLDYIIFMLLDPMSQVDIVEYHVLPDRGALITLSKPLDCRLGALSFVSVSIPKSTVHGVRSFPVLSHPSEDALMLLIIERGPWSRALLQHLQHLHSKQAQKQHPDDSIASTKVLTRDTQHRQEHRVAAEQQVSPTRALRRRPDRLTRLNTRLVYLTRSQVCLLFLSYESWMCIY